MVEMRNSLKFKVGVYLVVVLTIAVFIFAMMLVSNNREELLQQVTDNSGQLSRVVISSTRFAMLQNQPSHVDSIIQDVGDQEDIEKVRILSKDGVIKFMTDGILLAETTHDRNLKAYDTIIIDEAHERSLNIDFLLGSLKQLVKRRRDLRIIITSATIDTEKFSRHFNNAPVIEVSGRSYPVDVEYHPLGEDDPSSQIADQAKSRDLYAGIAKDRSKR